MNHAAQRRPIDEGTLSRARWKGRARRWTPLFVWSLVLLLTAALYGRQVRGHRLTGFAQERRYPVAAESTGRLVKVEVELNQAVGRGQIVASFATDDLRLELVEARAELQRAADELGREQALWQLDVAAQQVEQQTNLRRFARDVSSAHIDHLSALTDLAENRILLQGAELTLNRTLQLNAGELTAPSTLEADQNAYDALQERVTGLESTVAALAIALSEARDRHRTYVSDNNSSPPAAELLLKPLAGAIRVQEIRIERVDLAIQSRVLRAPVRGQVAALHCGSGEVVLPGQPVVTIQKTEVGGLVAYLPEKEIAQVQAGDSVRIRRKTEPNRVYESSIESLATGIELMPERLDPANPIPSWGLALYIPAPEMLAATPGESFEILLD